MPTSMRARSLAHACAPAWCACEESQRPRRSPRRVQSVVACCPKHAACRALRVAGCVARLLALRLSAPLALRVACCIASAVCCAAVKQCRGYGPTSSSSSFSSPFAPPTSSACADLPSEYLASARHVALVRHRAAFVQHRATFVQRRLTTRCNNVLQHGATTSYNTVQRRLTTRCSIAQRGAARGTDS